jgi:simple sugar transport system ATP-binding protein
VLRRLRAFASGGGSAVLVTHKLDEALAAADRITVLRNGLVVHTASASGETAAGLAAAMLGTAADAADRGQPTSSLLSDRTVISARAITLAREDGRGVALRDANVEVAAGEIVGVAGIEGSGQREMLRAIAGLGRPAAGTLTVRGPVAFIPEDRTTEGLIGELSVAENVALGMGATAPWVRRGRMDWSAVRRRAGHLISRYGIRAGGVDLPVSSLSGGNQQKLVVARALERGPRVVVAENPTRGLDVHATQSVWAELRRATTADAAVLAWSSDLDEIIAHADRILVVARGTVREAPAGADRTLIGAMMLGAESPA